MEPFGHRTHDNHHHHHHHRNEEHFPPPPPPPVILHHHNPPPPVILHHHNPPPPVIHHQHNLPPPPPPPVIHTFEPHVPYPSVQHVSHDLNRGFEPNSLDFHNESHHHQPHLPSFFRHHSHNHDKASELSNKPSVRVFTKAETDFSLTIRDGHVILARSDKHDPFQHWIKDEKYSTRVKDEEGFPSFSLVNKATGQAMKHSVGATYPVQLIPYNANHLDESILWTESKDLGEGFRTIRMVNNIRLNVDAFHGDKNHGGVHDGTTIVLWEWKKGDNQRWKIVPFCKSFNLSK